jgi:two-component system response regulator YesN
VANVLIVDDDLGTLAARDRILRRAGFDVTIAASGQDGLMLALDRSFEAILVDLKLPGITAIGMLAALRSRHLDVPFVVITAFGTIELAVHSLKLGDVDFVDKPLSDDDLVQLIRCVVNSRKMRAVGDSGVSRSDFDRTFDLRVHSALLIIDSAFRNSALRVRDVAMEVGVSTEHLCRLIKLHTGRSLRSHLTARRIESAQTLLAQSVFSVKEIAGRVGFGSTDRMDLSFRKICGMNPMGYRRRERLRMSSQTAELSNMVRQQTATKIKKRG